MVIPIQEDGKRCSYQIWQISPPLFPHDFIIHSFIRATACGDNKADGQQSQRYASETALGIDVDNDRPSSTTIGDFEIFALALPSKGVPRWSKPGKGVLEHIWRRLRFSMNPPPSPSAHWLKQPIQDLPLFPLPNRALSLWVALWPNLNSRCWPRESTTYSVLCTDCILRT